MRDFRSDSQQKSLENPDKQTMRMDSNKREEKLIEFPKKKLNIRLYSETEQKVQDFLSTKCVTMSIIILVALYAILIFVIVAMEDLMDSDQFNSVSTILGWIELGILIVFILEIIIGLYAWGIKKYYKDKWLILDTIIILLSLFFVIFELADQKTSNVIKVIQAVFRFLRIFLLIRKAQTFKRLATISTISTPAEKISRFLGELKEILEDENMKLDIDYCVDKIANNQLYSMGKLEDDNQDGLAWMNQNQSDRGSIIKRQVTDIQQQVQTRNKNISQFQKLNIPKKAIDILIKQHYDLYIDPFELDKVCGGEGLINQMMFFFEYYNLFDVFLVKPKIVRSYFEEVMKGYLDNPYHNRIHAQDVAQTCNFLLNKCKFIEIGGLDEQDIACILTAGAIHDYGHPGFTNAFLVNSRNDLALLYNDKSVLEMYHPSQCFKIAWSNQQANIFESLPFSKYRQIRESIISMVLSTDMAHHASELALTNSRVSASDFEPKGKDKQRLMDLIVHSSDVSNPTKGFEIYKSWTEKVLAEFWLQGDKEKDLGLPISYLCNRYTTNMAEAQVGFIDYVVKPTFMCIKSFLPIYEQFFPNLDKNKSKWQELIEHYANQLKNLQVSTKH